MKTHGLKTKVNVTKGQNSLVTFKILKKVTKYIRHHFHIEEQLRTEVITVLILYCTVLIDALAAPAVRRKHVYVDSSF